MSRPLILDVDGTFLKNDLTHEMILEAVKRDPHRAIGYLVTGLRNKPLMKQRMVARIADRLLRGSQPLEPEIVALAKQAKAQGREVYLCSGSEAGLVQRLAKRHDFLDGAFGTSPTYNMTSENKAAFLVDQFPAGFDYAGNSTQDFAVWDAAHSGYAIRPPHGTEETRTAADEPVEILVERQPFDRAFPKLLAGFELWKLLTLLLPVLIVTVLIGLGASATLWLGISLTLLMLARNLERMLGQLHKDRLRNRLRGNPVAAGELSVPAAIAGYVTLSIAGLAMISTLSPWLALFVVTARILLALFSRISDM